MEKEFVPFELAVKLKKLGFDDDCLGYYNEDEKLTFGVYYCYDQPMDFVCLAPLWQQAFSWFDINHKLRGDVIHADSNGGYTWIIWKWNEDNQVGKWQRITDITSFKDRSDCKVKLLNKLISLIK